MIVSVLAAFDISKARDEFGKEIEINDEYTTLGLLTYASLLLLPCSIRTYAANPSHKKPFKCSIAPRSAASRKLVEDLAVKDHF